MKNMSKPVGRGEKGHSSIGEKHSGVPVCSRNSPGEGELSLLVFFF